MSDASAKYLEETLARCAFAALNKELAAHTADAMDRRGPAFVLMGATPDELLEWKSAVRYLRVVIAGQLEETRVDT